MAVGGATEVERLVVRLLGDAKPYLASLGAARTATAKFAGGVRAAGASIASFGLGAKLGFGIAAASAVKAFADFDQAMTESISIMDTTIAQTERMKEAALTLSKEGIQGPTELAKSYFFLASAGLDAEQSIAALPAVQKFATAGAFDMSLATDLLTDAQSALGKVVKDDVNTNLKNMVDLSDILVKANTLANASVEQFSTALTSKAGAALKSFNKDAEEGVAVLAAMADQGIKAQLAGNALDRMIRLLSKSVRDNAEAHKDLGFKVFDGTGKMRNMGDIIANLEDVLKGMSDEVKVATLDMLGFEARTQQVILPLLGTSDAIKKYEAELRKAGGTTAEVSDKQMESFSNKLKVLKNNVSALAIDTTELLLPALEGLVKALGLVVKGLEFTVSSDAWKEFLAGIKDISTSVVGLGVETNVGRINPPTPLAPGAQGSPGFQPFRPRVEATEPMTREDLAGLDRGFSNFVDKTIRPKLAVAQAEAGKLFGQGVFGAIGSGGSLPSGLGNKLGELLVEGQRKVQQRTGKGVLGKSVDFDALKDLLGEKVVQTGLTLNAIKNRFGIFKDIEEKAPIDRSSGRVEGIRAGSLEAIAALQQQQSLFVPGVGKGPASEKKSLDKIKSAIGDPTGGTLISLTKQILDKLEILPAGLG